MSKVLHQVSWWTLELVDISPTIHSRAVALLGRTLPHHLRLPHHLLLLWHRAVHQTQLLLAWPLHAHHLGLMDVPGLLAWPQVIPVQDHLLHQLPLWHHHLHGLLGKTHLLPINPKHCPTILQPPRVVEDQEVHSGNSRRVGSIWQILLGTQRLNLQEGLRWAVLTRGLAKNCQWGSREGSGWSQLCIHMEHHNYAEPGWLRVFGGDKVVLYWNCNWCQVPFNLGTNVIAMAWNPNLPHRHLFNYYMQKVIHLPSNLLLRSKYLQNHFVSKFATKLSSNAWLMAHQLHEGKYGSTV